MSESKIAKLNIHGLTDEGLVRKHNEDMIAWDTESGLVIVADGMGGHNAGEVASQIAVNSLTQSLSASLSTTSTTKGKPVSAYMVKKAVTLANSEINQHAKDHPECSGMGTTVVMALFQQKSVILASVGDSRIYRLRQGGLKQLTSDHSFVQEMVDNGYMTEEEALASNNRNLITRALGIEEEVQVDVAEHKIKQNDIFLLCSDGLSDMVEEKDIFSTLVKARNDVARGCKDLVKLAKENGGHDNISVILVACK